MSVLVLDIGSSSVRSSLWDEQGGSQGEAAQLEHRARAAPDGTAELDPEALFELVAQALDAAMEARPDVEAVAISTLWHALLGLDGDGRPLTPIYSWADRRAAAAAARLRGELDEDAVHQRTGCRLHSSYWPAKLAWLRETDAEAFERVRTWISPGEYVQRRLLGDATASISMASGTGLLDHRTCTWDEELTRGIEDRLPPIDDTPRSGLTSRVGRALARAARRPLVPGLGRRGVLQPRQRLRHARARGADGRHERRAAGAVAHRRGAGDHAWAVALPRRRPARRDRRVAVGRRQRLRLAEAAHAPARGRGRDRAGDRGDGARLARPDRPAAALGRARAGLERRGRGDDRRADARHRAARPAARERSRPSRCASA